VTVFAEFPAGETIDGAAFVALTDDEQALFLKSDGSNWRVISNTGAGAVSSNISLDLTYDPFGAGDVPPIYFTTWAGILAAVAQIPGNPLAPYATPYRLNIADFSGIPGGVYDIFNAELRSAIQSSPSGYGAGIFGYGSFVFENVASIEGVTVGGFSLGHAFTWNGIYDFVDIKDCEFGQSLNFPAGPAALLIPDFTDFRFRFWGNTTLGVRSIDVGEGSLLTIDVYDRSKIRANAINGALAGSDCLVNLYSPATNISLNQSLTGTFEINIGGGSLFLPPASDDTYTLGETIFFSSGGPILFNAATEQELYAGGTNPPGAAPQTPPFSSPQRGYTAPKDGYLRGVGITIPVTEIIGLTFDITVYVSGLPVIVESFTTSTVRQYSEFTFGRYFESDEIRVTITPTSTDPDTSLTEGILVSLRSS
jgi:hypothetical protein